MERRNVVFKCLESVCESSNTLCYKVDMNWVSGSVSIILLGFCPVLSYKINAVKKTDTI